jgi:hypothetical protein
MTTKKSKATSLEIVGRGHALYAGLTTKKNFEQLADVGLSEDDYDDLLEELQLVAYGINPSLFKLVINGEVVVSSAQELIGRYAITMLPDANVIEFPKGKLYGVGIVEFEKGNWVQASIDNFDPQKLTFEVKKWSFAFDTAYSILIPKYDGVALELGDDALRESANVYALHRDGDAFEVKSIEED